jgi:hypothetical protein
MSRANWVEAHVFDPCKTCGACRSARVNFVRRRFKATLPTQCDRKGACRYELGDILGVPPDVIYRATATA